MKHNPQYGDSSLSDDDLLALVYENELIIGKIEQQLEEQLRIMGALGVEDSTLDRVRKAYGYNAVDENKVRLMLNQLEKSSGQDQQVSHSSTDAGSIENNGVNNRVKRSRHRSFI
ncbi:hypothetical protein A9Q99_14710 [Gammaproteobacteria bacterium 45_16_T64]|nr:hypothetical protein A9Q99_14710 [Gammaproteobacteria bacterium 45_16_T64]